MFQRRHHVEPDADRAERLVVRHRGACRHVVRPGSDRCADQRRRSRPDRRDGAGDPGIDHTDSGADPRGKHVDRRTTVEEVRDHLRRHVGGIRRHALAHDAVVGRCDDDRTATVGPSQIAGDPGELDRQRLETPEAARWLGQGVEPRRRRDHGGRVEPTERDDALDRLLESARVVAHRGPFSVTGSPATNRYASSAMAASR